MSNIHSQTLQPHQIEAPQVFETLVSALSRLPRLLFATLLMWQRRAQERHHLATIGPRLLSDMGISEAEAAREAAIPFWRLQ